MNQLKMIGPREMPQLISAVKGVKWWTFNSHSLQKHEEWLKPVKSFPFDAHQTHAKEFY